MGYVFSKIKNFENNCNIMNATKSKEESKEIRVNLEEEFNDSLKVLKKYYKIKNTTEIMRYILTKEVRYVKTFSFIDELLSREDTKENLFRIIDYFIENLYSKIKELKK